MAGIRLDNVRKSFDGKAVIQGISLDVPDGAFLVLLGPSGCGKSTLLRMIAGLEALTSGTIHVGARRVDQLPPGERDMAFVFQSYALYPHMTVRGNITFPLLMQRFRWWFHLPVVGWFARRRVARDPAVMARVDGAARTLGLTPMMDRKPATLSGGQRQRVALGRAMVRNPQVFLMDEPLSNLDAKLRTSMRAEIGKLHRDVGGTFVYVTHDQVEAMTMGSQIVVLKEGAVQQVGTAQAIYEQPANVYVARFIGSPPMNVLVGHAQGGQVTFGGQATGSGQATGGGPIIEGGITLALPAPDGPILVGIRPDALTLVPPGEGLQGTVTLVEVVGADSVVSVAIDGLQTRHDTDATAGEVIATVRGHVGARGQVGVPGQVGVQVGARVGDRVGVQVATAGAVLFSDAGDRL